MNKAPRQGIRKEKRNKKKPSLEIEEQPSPPVTPRASNFSEKPANPSPNKTRQVNNTRPSNHNRPTKPPGLPLMLRWRRTILGIRRVRARRRCPVRVESSCTLRRISTLALWRVAALLGLLTIWLWLPIGAWAWGIRLGTTIACLETGRALSSRPI